ncbi:unnamed protein product [Phytophthora fragariaefolia]|uniref:Unnamed protein product n=1 Tax=Phytophthora fragariaefolia TaxID=1490495 RepID=A0A9W6X9C2_9STRA|nr:unnamed protein product [Phytophthora fragariaefolia]
MHPIPTNIRDAINAFEPPDGFIVRPPRRNETSVIFAYGVRLVKAPESLSAEPDASAPAIWMSLAGEVCRGSDISFPLSTGKTPAATKHLKKAHDVTSEKTETAIEDELDRVRSSPMFRDDPGRVYVLLVFKDAMQATINAKVVCHTIIELYTSTKRALEEVLQLNRIGSAPTFTTVADFWTSKVQGVNVRGVFGFLFGGGSLISWQILV